MTLGQTLQAQQPFFVSKCFKLVQQGGRSATVGQASCLLTVETTALQEGSWIHATDYQ